jgi:Domain of unknown function (DUF4214)
MVTRLRTYNEPIDDLATISAVQQQQQQIAQTQAPTVDQDLANFLTGAYKAQLGRMPDDGGMQYYLEQLSSGAKTQAQIIAELNKSLEGQNYDTQVLTSEYRQTFGRDPEQEGYQYWMSRLQDDPNLVQGVVDDYLIGGARGVDASTLAAAPANFTEIVTAALQADPFGGRRATQDMYAVGADTPNVSMIGNMAAQFVNPVTQRAGVSVYDPVTGEFKYQLGQDVLDPQRVKNAIDIARGSGALSAAQAESLFSTVSSATNMDQLRAALAAPQATVVLDELYGMQIGEDANALAARAEAAARQQVLNNFEYYPAYDNFGASLEAAGQVNPFAAQNYYAPTMATPGSVVTPENFGQKLADTVNMSFAGSNFVPSYVQPGFYSERGFEPEFVGFGEAPTFRSGVFGYNPNIPQGFQFGMPNVTQSFTPFVPGAFDPGYIDEKGDWKPTPPGLEPGTVPADVELAKTGMGGGNDVNIRQV